MRQTIIATAFMFALGIALLNPSRALALDDAHWQQADVAIERGIAYLRTTQNEDGSWSPEVGPAITAMAVRAMLQRPNIGPDDPAVAKAVTYILSMRKPDGGIYDRFLANYNTSICLSALAMVNSRPGVAEAIADGQRFLVSLQWQGQKDSSGRVVDEGHPFYGGAGYGDSKHGRPDMSNTQFMLEALYDTGMSCDDPAFKRALVYISRCQGIEQNDMFAKQITPDGGFIYATTISRDHIGVPQSQASPEQVDAADAGRAVSGLRTYGSMTYAGFKSYIYADLDRNDPRVKQAADWIRRHYTIERNPGMPEAMEKQGLYYYYITFARAMDAWGVTTVAAADGQSHDWANDLIGQLASLQRDDGSWLNEADRWYESNPDLVTGYALLALSAAVH